MGIKAIDLRRGIAVEWNNKTLHRARFRQGLEGQLAASFIQVKLRDTNSIASSNSVSAWTMNSSQAFLDQKPMEYLYSEQGKHRFMNLEDYDQIEYLGRCRG